MRQGELRSYLFITGSPDPIEIERLGMAMPGFEYPVIEDAIKRTFDDVKSEFVKALAISAVEAKTQWATIYGKSVGKREADIASSALDMFSDVLRLESFQTAVGDTGDTYRNLTIHGLRGWYGLRSEESFNKNYGYPITEFEFPEPSELAGPSLVYENL